MQKKRVTKIFEAEETEWGGKQILVRKYKWKAMGRSVWSSSDMGSVDTQLVHTHPSAAGQLRSSGRGSSHSFCLRRLSQPYSVCLSPSGPSFPSRFLSWRLSLFFSCFFSCRRLSLSLFDWLLLFPSVSAVYLHRSPRWRLSPSLFLSWRLFLSFSSFFAVAVSLCPYPTVSACFRMSLPVCLSPSVSVSSVAVFYSSTAVCLSVHLCCLRLSPSISVNIRLSRAGRCLSQFFSLSLKVLSFVDKSLIFIREQLSIYLINKCIFSDSIYCITVFLVCKEIIFYWWFFYFLLIFENWLNFLFTRSSLFPYIQHLSREFVDGTSFQKPLLVFIFCFTSVQFQFLLILSAFDSLFQVCPHPLIAFVLSACLQHVCLCLLSWISVR